MCTYLSGRSVKIADLFIQQWILNSQQSRINRVMVSVTCVQEFFLGRKGRGGHFYGHFCDVWRIRRRHQNSTKLVTNHFHRVLVVVRPVKPLFDFPKSIIAASVSKKRSRVALFEDPRLLFLGDNKSSKRCAILLLGHVEQGL